jgi:hypothetical protein
MFLQRPPISEDAAFPALIYARTHLGACYTALYNDMHKSCIITRIPEILHMVRGKTDLSVVSMVASCAANDRDVPLSDLFRSHK